jgi:hypothetical protein
MEGFYDRMSEANAQKGGPPWFSQVKELGKSIFRPFVLYPM